MESIPTENQFEARSTLVLTMMDASSFATLARKMKSEIDNFNPDTKTFSYTFIGIVAYTLILQALIAFLLLMSYRFEVRKEYSTALVLNDWLIVGILVVILLNSVILTFEKPGGEETSFFRGKY